MHWSRNAAGKSNFIKQPLQRLWEIYAAVNDMIFKFKSLMWMTIFILLYLYFQFSFEFTSSPTATSFTPYVLKYVSYLETLMMVISMRKLSPKYSLLLTSFFTSSPWNKVSWLHKPLILMCYVFRIKIYYCVIWVSRTNYFLVLCHILIEIFS